MTCTADNRGRPVKDLLRRTQVYHVRAAKRMSLLKLEELTGIPAGRISNYERGIQLPRVDAAIILAQALHVSVEELFRGQI